MNEKGKWPQPKQRPEPEIITKDPKTGEPTRVRKEDVGPLIRKENEQDNDTY